MACSVVVGVLALMLLAGCSSSSSPASSPQYQRRGPDSVGVTTLDLGSAGPVFGERLATVYYPADPSTVAGHPKFGYTEASTLPKSVQGIIPAKFNTTTTVDAYTGAPASKPGPYPIVLFSHGYGGERLYYSTLLTGIAAWGYVVVSADYLERGLAAQVLGSKTKPTAALDSSIMQSSLTAVEHASSQASSVLHGVADPHRVAAVGHSAGGQTAFDALRQPGGGNRHRLGAGGAGRDPVDKAGHAHRCRGRPGGSAGLCQAHLRFVSGARRRWSRSRAKGTTPTPTSASGSGRAAA